MPSFNQRSKDNLKTVDFLLQNLFNEVIERIDCSVICGHRGKEEQNEAFDKKASKVRYPDSKHNSFPSMAVDVYPYPFDWDNPDSLTNLKKLYFFGGIVKGIAWELGIKVRWGGDWDSDNDLEDQNFNDLVHWEVKK